MSLIPTAEINNVIKAAQNGDQKSFDQIVYTFQNFIIYVLKKNELYNCCKQSGNLSDVIGAGNLGLIHAVKKFDTTSKNPFIPYAQICIKGSVYDYLNSDYQIHYSKKVIQDINKIKKSKKKLIDNEDQITKLSEKTKISEKRILGLKKYEYQFIPLIRQNSESNKEYNVDDTEDIAETVYSDSIPEQNLEKYEIHTRLLQAFKILDKRELFVLTRVYGINCEKMSYPKIGKLLDISKQRISQIHNSIIKKLRKQNCIQQLSDYLIA